MSALCQKRTYAVQQTAPVIRSPRPRRRGERRVADRQLAVATLIDAVQRQCKMKNRASGRTSRHPYLTMVAFDDRLADRETHSHPACFGRGHWFKNATEIGYTNSTPGIRDRDKDGVINPTLEAAVSTWRENALLHNCFLPIPLRRRPAACVPAVRAPQGATRLRLRR